MGLSVEIMSRRPSLRAVRPWSRSPAAVCLVLLAAACLVACGDDEETVVPVIGGPVLIGTGTNLVGLEGEWRLTGGVTADACGTSIFPLLDEAIVAIAQQGQLLAFEVFSPCGTPIAQGSGSVDFEGNVLLLFEESIAVNPTCTLTIDHVQAGVAAAPAASITGTRTLTLSADGDCGPGLPCDVSGPFTAIHCPPGDCSFDDCD